MLSRAQPPNYGPLFVFIVGAERLLSIGLFLAGILTRRPALWIAGGLLMAARDVFEVWWGLLKPQFPILLAIIVAIFVKPWYLGVFWSLFVFHVLDIPGATVKVLAPRASSARHWRRAVDYVEREDEGGEGMSKQDCVFVTKDGRLEVLRSGVIRFRGVSAKTRGEATYETPGNQRRIAEAGLEIKALLAGGSTGTAAERPPVHLDVLSDYERDLVAVIGPTGMVLLVRDLRTTDSLRLWPSFDLQEAGRFAEAMVEAAKDASAE